MHSSPSPHPRITAVPPAERPWHVRRAARVLVVSPGEREPEVLLMQDTDPGIPGMRWWVTPGGGIDPDETPADAAVREVFEETGYRATAEELLGPVAHRVARHGYSDRVLEQEEWFFLLAAPRFRVSTEGHTAAERLKMVGSRWWPLSALAASEEWIWPADLLDLVASADAPHEWPRELGLVVTESTVPVDPADRPPGGSC